MGTCAIGQMHDDTSGLRAILGPQAAFKTEAGLEMPATKGIGAEIAQLCEDGELDGVPVRPKFSLDFAAIRGFRAGRGKCAALCACRGQECLQSYPGGGDIPDLPAGDTVEEYRAAEAIAQEQCSWASDKMKFGSLRSAAHTPQTTGILRLKARGLVRGATTSSGMIGQSMLQTWCD